MVQNQRFLLLLLLNELKNAINASKQQMSRHLLLALVSVQAEGNERTARKENYGLLQLSTKRKEKKTQIDFYF